MGDAGDRGPGVVARRTGTVNRRDAILCLQCGVRTGPFWLRAIHAAQTGRHGGREDESSQVSPVRVETYPSRWTRLDNSSKEDGDGKADQRGCRAAQLLQVVPPVVSSKASKPSVPSPDADGRDEMEPASAASQQAAAAARCRRRNVDPGREVKQKVQDLDKQSRSVGQGQVQVSNHTPRGAAECVCALRCVALRECACARGGSRRKYRVLVATVALAGGAIHRPAVSVYRLLFFALASCRDNGRWGNAAIACLWYGVSDWDRSWPRTHIPRHGWQAANGCTGSELTRP
jgi:hypothetical protein